jgi:hypothetical protein
VIALAAAPLLLSGCDEGGSFGDDDDDVTPPTDDDDAVDDDDVTPTDDDDAEPMMTFDPSEARAGEVRDIAVTITDFDISQGSLICCTENISYWSTLEELGDDTYLFRFFFGLHADGTEPWGLDNQTEQVIGEFEVEPLGVIPSVTPGIGAASGEMTEPAGFQVYSFEVTEPETLVWARVTNVAPLEFHPWIWAIGQGGIQTLAYRGFQNDDGEYDTPRIGFGIAEPGTYYLRVADANFAGGPGWEFGLDFAMQAAPAPTDVVEVEPNDEAAGWQDLGTLGTGRWSLSGVAETAGHTDDDAQNLDGDLDAFRFQLAGDATVAFELAWDGEDDFDAVLYDDTLGDTVFGWGSEQLLSAAMATAAKPERLVIDLAGGVPYVLEIGNWDGQPGSAWTMSVTVVEQAFPGDPPGDDDDSAADDDDSAR